jgi:excisionase family DNA binding protein
MTQFLTTKELAELLRIKERKVYDLANSGEITCTKATGKLLFPREEIDQWLSRNTRKPSSDAAERPNVLLGSHDPILEWALRESGCGIATYFDGSEDGLSRFERHEGIAAGLHLRDAETGAWNVPFVEERFAEAGAVLIRWAARRRGLVLRRNIAGQVPDLAAMAGRTFAPRQESAGAQHLFRQLLAEAGLAYESLQIGRTARTEAEAALAVLEGEADAAFGLELVSQQHGLHFVPVIEEYFDLLVDRRDWFEPPFQTFLSFCDSDAFVSRAKATSGYDFSSFGHVTCNSRN